MTQEPKTLLEAVRYYSDIRVCVRLLASVRWPEGITCPCCSSKEITAFKTRQIWKCRTCKKQFSVKVGTIFEKSPLGLDKWFVCSWLIANSKNGVSSCELARSLGVTQKTAWFMLHRMREVMAGGMFQKLKGTVEVDESYFGGKDANRHANKKHHVTGGADKTAVLGMIERDGNVVAKVIPGTDEDTVGRKIKTFVELGVKLFTDEASRYNEIGRSYEHSTVNHSKGEYVKGDVSTNGIENYWSLLKRALKGTYISVMPFHLNRYATEQSFRYNYRKTNDANRFMIALGNVPGRRLTYARLIAHK